MKCQISFSGKNKKTIPIFCLLKILPRVLSVNIVSYFSSKSHIVGNHQKCLHDCLMSTYDVCVHEEIKKYFLVKNCPLSRVICEVI